MNLSVAMVFHGIAIAGQILNGLSTIFPTVGLILPPEYRAQIAVILAAGQAAIGWIQHHWNTNGTPQTVGYEPSK